MNNETKIQLCRADFYDMLSDACAQAGGVSDIEKLKRTTFRDVVEMLAQNGLRMVYMPTRHMDSVEVNWRPVGDNGQPPKKKQLLCDQAEARENFHCNPDPPEKTIDKWVRDDMGGQ